MNLLEKFAAVTIESDHCISPADKEFCERQQSAYEAAIKSFQELSFFWEDIVNTQMELLDRPDYPTTERYKYLKSGSGPDISPEKISDHIEWMHREFIHTIVRYFNATYHISIDYGDVDDNLLPRRPEGSWVRNKEEHEAYHEKMQSLIVQHRDIVDQVILRIEGRSFAEQALYELKAKCHAAVWDRYDKAAKYEQKNNVIRFTGYFCRDSSWCGHIEWELKDNMKDIMRGAAYYETGCHQVYPLGFSELFGYRSISSSTQEFPTCQKVQRIRLFKSGRVDLRFATEEQAQEFAADYLGLVY